MLKINNNLQSCFFSDVDTSIVETLPKPRICWKITISTNFLIALKGPMDKITIIIKLFITTSKRLFWSFQICFVSLVASLVFWKYMCFFNVFQSISINSNTNSKNANTIFGLGTLKDLHRSLTVIKIPNTFIFLIQLTALKCSALK